MKFKELPQVGARGAALKTENALIKSVTITNNDHGVLTAYLFLEFGSGGAGFGGVNLGKGDDKSLQHGPDFAATFLVRCINTVTDSGYGTWEQLAGRPVRVLHEGLGGTVVAVGHFLRDDWFCPRVEFETSPA